MRTNAYSQAIWLVAVAVMLQGCALFQNVNPSAVAETPEQHAFAKYGTFVVFEELAADAIEDPAFSESIKARIRSADARLKPAADSMLEVATEVGTIRAELAAAQAAVAATEGDVRDAAQIQRDSLDARLQAVSANLTRWIETVSPLITELIAALRGN